MMSQFESSLDAGIIKQSETIFGVVGNYEGGLSCGDNGASQGFQLQEICLAPYVCYHNPKAFSDSGSTWGTVRKTSTDGNAYCQQQGHTRMEYSSWYSTAGDSSSFVEWTGTEWHYSYSTHGTLFRTLCCHP